jgi:diaminopimelate decarboxylase
MYPFIEYKNNALFVEDVDVAKLAAEVGTPFYCYSSAALKGAYARLKKSVNHPRVSFHYAVKALPNIAVIKTLASCGAKMDIVSGGELKRCLAAGVDPKNIVFSGVGKSDEEIRFAIEKGIYRINLESIPEMEAVSAIAQSLNKRVPVALRINPEVAGAGAHEKISTGAEEDKFGINWDHVEETAARCGNALDLAGITCHIGSQITDVAPFAEAANRIVDMVTRLRKAGHNIRQVSLGGGLGISYEGEEPPVEDYGALVHATAERLACDVELEPGRCLVGEAGILVSKVLYVKHGTAKDFLVIDAAMNDLIRPTLYEAYHPIVPVAGKQSPAMAVYDVVGPVCESGDFLALDRELPTCHKGDLIALLCAGAYGSSMSSTYNSRALVPEVLVSGVKTAVIRARLTIEQQLAWETAPDWT